MQREPLRKGERVVLYAGKKISSIEPFPEGWSWKIVRWPFSKGWTHGGLSLELLRHPPDLFFTPVHEIPLFHRRTKIVNTIHDVAFAIEPKTYSPLARWRQQWAIKRAVRYADHLITVSETTKRDLHRLYHVPLERMSVTPLAIDIPAQSGEQDQQIRTQLRVYNGKYLLSIGRVEEKKNIGMLLEAFFTYKRKRGIGDPLQLVLAGSQGEGSERFKKQIAQSPFGSQVRLLGYISDEQKWALLRGASAYVFPSRYEGFGLPALEAFSQDCPLIASDIPALREVAQEAALYAPVNSVTVWVEQIDRMMTDETLRHQLIEAGQERLLHFSWDQTARQTWEVLRNGF